ncbi:MAG: penicillin-binding transpeptidase domain-containing protein [Vicinamibacterales bacterium]
MAESSVHIWRRTLKRRLIVAAAGLGLWTVAIEARLVYLQVVRHADLSARAERQQMRTVAAPAKRGEILDRRGRVLAYSVDAESIYAVPSEIEQPRKAVAALCGVLEDCTAKEREALVERFSRQRAFAYVRREVSPEQARRVRALDLEGIGFMKESRRFYPNKELASHLVGYVGIDGTGLHGIESTYDSLIKGRAGTVLIQTDARRHAFSRVEKPPTTGATLELTIDQYLQHIAERELQSGVEATGAEGGSAIIMAPATGEILAMANWPTFNPNAYRQAREEAQRNRAVQDLYEPGSTFKIVTASAALEEKVVQPGDPIDVSAGLIRFGSRVITDDHRHGVLSFSDVIVKSSNVGAIKVGLRLGRERLGAYVRRFGFGGPVSPDFPGESPGIVWDPSRLTDSALASVAMGYQVAVTPLQMAAAVSAVANGGELVQPRAVRAVIRDGTRVPVPRKVVRRTIGAATAAELTRIMEGVVEKGGTATRASLAGYTVAGKTGTAQKLVNGRYNRTDYNVSFVGFVPSRRPVFTIVVVVDAPRVNKYGGLAAAPVFQRIADAALRHTGVPPTLNAAPPVLVARREQPREVPTAGPAGPPSILTIGEPAVSPHAAFPDLRGMSAREALRVLVRLGLTARMHGTGVVVEHVPEPGAPFDGRTSSELWLERQPVALGPGGSLEKLASKAPNGTHP